VLPDLLAPGLALVVCGSAAGRRSAELRQYYAGRGNKFWPTLERVGLTPRRLLPSEYPLLPAFGIGLTDVVKAQSGADSELDFRQADPEALRAKILRYQPRLLCFNGKRAARTFLCRARVDYGLQAERIGATRLFVAPSTSGAASGSFDLRVWRRLARRVLAARASARGPAPV
jgi:TDG/mug DNA glycosylase family protein